jgi:hypothetical protein
LIPNSIGLQSLVNPKRRSSLAEGCTLPSSNPSARTDLRIKIHLVIHLDFHSRLWYLAAAPNFNWFESSIWSIKHRIIKGNTVQRRLSEPQLSEQPSAKSSCIISSYWLLYWNITKPVKAVQEFIILSKFICVFFLFLYKRVNKCIHK